MAIKILDVGQCGFDGPRMARLWTEGAGAIVERCANGAEAMQLISHNAYDIIMVNRILAADRSSGLNVIRTLVASGVKAPIMLVSDLATAQDEAVALGAVRGFGKAALSEQSTLDLVVRVATGQKSSDS